MIESVVSVGYPVDETLHIKKNRLTPEKGLSGGEKRISIVTGTHGDELEGQYVAWKLNRVLREHPEQSLLENQLAIDVDKLRRGNYLLQNFALFVYI